MAFYCREHCKFHEYCWYCGRKANNVDELENSGICLFCQIDLDIDEASGYGYGYHIEKGV